MIQFVSTLLVYSPTNTFEAGLHNHEFGCLSKTPSPVFLRCGLGLMYPSCPNWKHLQILSRAGERERKKRSKKWRSANLFINPVQNFFTLTYLIPILCKHKSLHLYRKHVPKKYENEKNVLPKKNSSLFSCIHIASQAFILQSNLELLFDFSFYLDDDQRTRCRFSPLSFSLSGKQAKEIRNHPEFRHATTFGFFSHLPLL